MLPKVWEDRRRKNRYYVPGIYSEDYHLYKKLLQEQCERSGVKIVAYCLMTNHVHLIAIPAREESLAKAIGEAHRLYTRAINFRQNTRGFLFQGRFFSTPLDETHFFAALRYVAQNPVRANMVDKAWKYPYSSTRFHIGMEQNDTLLSHYEPLESIQDWKGFLDVAPDEIGFIRYKIQTGRPCGGESFYATIATLTGVDYTPRKTGRPKKKK